MTQTRTNMMKTTIIGIVLVIIIILIIVLFLAVPDGDALKNTMDDKNFETVFDINKDTLLLGLLLPDGATRSLTFMKNINGDIDNVVVIYFDTYKARNAYYNDLDESDDDEIAFRRGKAVIMGTKDATVALRFRLWAY